MELIALNHFILDDFVNYLKKEKSYTHNSSQKLVQPMKTVSEYCHKKGLLEVDLIKDYQIKLEKTERGFLREDELQKLLKKKFPVTRLEKVRDIFLFSCFAHYTQKLTEELLAVAVPQIAVTAYECDIFLSLIIYRSFLCIFYYTLLLFNCTYTVVSVFVISPFYKYALSH